MNNNDVIRSLRYTFALNDAKMVAIFALTGQEISQELVTKWLKKDDHTDFKACQDIELSTFLNGFIYEKRGKKEGTEPKNEKTLTNNIILKKLKIALDLKSEDVLEILALADLSMSKHELSAFFRKPEHKNFRECKDQILRKFLKGLQLKYRPK